MHEGVTPNTLIRGNWESRFGGITSGSIVRFTQEIPLGDPLVMYWTKKSYETATMRIPKDTVGIVTMAPFSSDERGRQYPLAAELGALVRVRVGRRTYCLPLRYVEKIGQNAFELRRRYVQDRALPSQFCPQYSGVASFHYLPVIVNNIQTLWASGMGRRLFVIEWGEPALVTKKRRVTGVGVQFEADHTRTFEVPFHLSFVGLAGPGEYISIGATPGDFLLDMALQLGAFGLPPAAYTQWEEWSKVEVESMNSESKVPDVAERAKVVQRSLNTEEGRRQLAKDMAAPVGPATKKKATAKKKTVTKKKSSPPKPRPKPKARPKGKSK